MIADLKPLEGEASTQIKSFAPLERARAARAAPASATTWVREMSKRRVFRLAAIYIAGAWGLTEIITGVAEALYWPDWTRTAAVVMFIVGFPIAMVLSWQRRRVSG